jgi:hypothetical protein
MFTKKFWLDALERAAKTFAQDLAAPLAIVGVGHAVNVPWLQTMEVGGVAALLSVLMSIISLPVSGNGSASLIRGVYVGRHEVANPPTQEVTN